MPVSGSTEVTIPPYQSGPSRLITAASFLTDRFVPECEIIALPPKVAEGGVLTAKAETGRTAPRRTRSGLRKLIGSRSRSLAVRDRVIFDLRLRMPQNWAHFLNNHLPIYFHLAGQFDLDWSETLLLLPANTPGYIRAAAALFGLETLCTDDDLTGDRIVFAVNPWTAVRALRADWVQGAPIEKITSEITAAAPAKTFPKRIFLSRKTTRALSNSVEVESFLSGFGFHTVYPEDLSALDQMQLFREAETVVAIHGAALAPLLYSPAPLGPRQIVELMPCGHMTDVYRVLAEQVGSAWIGVRGRLKPEYIKPAYASADRFDAFSLDSFEVDPRSLELAFDLATHPIKKV